MTTVSRLKDLEEMAREVRAACADSYPPFDSLEMRRIRRIDAKLNGTLERFNAMEAREIKERMEVLEEQDKRRARERTALQQQLIDANTLADVNAARGLAGADYKQHETKGDEQ